MRDPPTDGEQAEPIALNREALAETARAVPVTLHGTAAHVLRVPGCEEALRIEVSMPAEYARTACLYPTVYLLDGHWYFPIVARMAELLELGHELPPLIVVGIGYEPLEPSPEQEQERRVRLRCRDLTPTHDPGEWWRQAGADQPTAPGVSTGGAREFFQIVESCVKPFVRARYRVDARDETLAGHSLGGLCTLDVLFRQPECYRRYLASSPSLWWDHEVIFDIERDRAAAHADLDRDLFLCVGALEESGAVAVSHMVSNVQRLAEVLRARSYPSFRCRARVFDDVAHVSGVPTALVQGLQFLFCTQSAAIFR